MKLTSFTCLSIICIFCFKKFFSTEDQGNNEEVGDLSPTLVTCRTTKGPFDVEVYWDWAPLGASRFLDLVEDGFFTDIAMFRTVENFLSQFGISDQPKFKLSNPDFMYEDIEDDIDLGLGIKKYYMSFAGHGFNSRGTQVFIAFKDLDWLGPRGDVMKMNFVLFPQIQATSPFARFARIEENGARTGTWETPFGKVVQGFEVLDALYKGYGDTPDQQRIHDEGNNYIRKNFPLMDFIETCSIQGRGSDSRTISELGVHVAAGMGDMARLRYAHGRHPHVVQLRDENEWQPLHEASRAGHIEAVRFLVEQGADTGAKTIDGATPLWWARKFLPEDHEVISYLVGIEAPEEGPEEEL